MNELVEKVEAWATERNLNDADPKAQMLKLVEEVGEIAAAIARDDLEEAKDGIRDATVVLTILAMQMGMSLEECLQQAYREIKERKGIMFNGVFVKEEDLGEEVKK